MLLSEVCELWLSGQNFQLQEVYVEKEKHDQGPDAKAKRDRGRDRFLSATYADLPAPDMKWEEMPPAPVPRLDGAAIQINNLLYVFSGYRTLDYVITNVLDFVLRKVFHSLSFDTSSVIVETDASYFIFWPDICCY